MPPRPWLGATPHLNARLTLDEYDRVRGINHLDELWPAETAGPRTTAPSSLRRMAATLEVDVARFDDAHQSVGFLQPGQRGTEYRHSEEEPLFDATTEGFYQSHLNVPASAAGITVTVKHSPTRVVSAVDTSLADVQAQLPSDEAIRRWREVFSRGTRTRTSAGLAAGASGHERRRRRPARGPHRASPIARAR